MVEAYSVTSWFCGECRSASDTEEEANACCAEEEPEPEEENND